MLSGHGMWVDTCVSPLLPAKPGICQAIWHARSNGPIELDRNLFGVFPLPQCLYVDGWQLNTNAIRSFSTRLWYLINVHSFSPSVTCPTQQRRMASQDKTTSLGQ